MHLREAGHHAVGIMVARTPVPPFYDIGRARLHCAIRDTRPQEGMSMTAGANIWVHISNRLPFRGHWYIRLAIRHTDTQHTGNKYEGHRPYQSALFSEST